MNEATITQAPVFDLTGGRLCLDFINTLDYRATAPLELLTNYGDLIAWGQQAHALTGEEALHLLAQAALHQPEADRVLQQAVTVREALYRIFAALAQETAPADTDIQLLNDALAQTMAHARLVPGEDSFVWGWQAHTGALDRVLWEVVRSAADLLTSDELHDVRICSANDCSWLFLDTSKNHSRRWCNMGSCGNRAKARRHTERKKQASRSSL